jgi:hypothetical protein
MKAENKKYLIYGGVAFLVGSLGYFIYSTFMKKTPIVVETVTTDSTDEELASTTTPKVNPFTSLLNTTLPSSIEYKPTDLSSYFKK